MFPGFMLIVYYGLKASYYAVEHRQTILSIYSIYDFTKFSFYVCDRTGIVRIVSNALKKNTHSTNILLELIGIEHSSVGEFEILDVS